MHDTSAAALTIMAIVIVVGLATQLIAAQLAARKPFFARPRRESMPTGVRGGRHEAVGGRSVMPHRTAPAAAQPDLEAAAEPGHRAPDAPAVPRARLREGSVPVPRTVSERASEARTR